MRGPQERHRPERARDRHRRITLGDAPVCGSSRWGQPAVARRRAAHVGSVSQTPRKRRRAGSFSFLHGIPSIVRSPSSLITRI